MTEHDDSKQPDGTPDAAAPPAEAPPPETPQAAAPPEPAPPEAPPPEPPPPPPKPVRPRPLRIYVTRGEKMDVAEWLPDDGRRPPDEALPRLDNVIEQPGGILSGPILFAIFASIAIIAGTWLFVRSSAAAGAKPLATTVADLSAVHAGVSVGGGDVRKLRRLAIGDVVESDADGRARIRLDDGAVLVVDRQTKLVVTERGVRLEQGRLFVQGAQGAKTELELGAATAILSGANAGVDRRAGSAQAKVYAATAELTVRAKGGETTVRAGDTASIDGDTVKVAPEKGFDDWTGGLAAPWGAKGAPRRAVGELWGRPAASPAGEVGSPLTIRSHDVHATIDREVATTEVKTTYFNGGSDPVLGDFRMAIPTEAIVSRFAMGVRADDLREGNIALAQRGTQVPLAQQPQLEWAGEGWLRGSLPPIAPGQTMTVVIEYVEWLSPAKKPGSPNVVVQYRYPMVSEGAPPLISEFAAQIDASPSSPVALASGLDARVSGQTVEVRRHEYRPTADLVVDVELEPARAPARAFVASGPEDDDAGGVLVVRTEAPEASREDGVTLALVLDVSASIDPSLLDAEKSLVEAVVSGLGARNRLAVLAADQTVHAVGPTPIGPLDDARKKAILDALRAVTPGGATDLGRALEAGADALPADAPAGLVVYVGDGWPTVGDAHVDAIQARLARRPGGAPRLGAVGVGPLVNKFALAALARGSGPMLEIADSTDAATAAVSLVAEALRPTVAGVKVVFGPDVERIYPRGARAVPAGETVETVGRIRGEPPQEITLVWRDAKGEHTEKRQVVSTHASNDADARRRWAGARVEEIALSGKGREAATDVALRAGLLTPWTGWTLGPVAYAPTTLSTRILDLSASGPDAAFAAALGTPAASAGTLSAVPRETDDEPGEDTDDATKQAVSNAAERILDAAMAAVRACRDSRAALRPEIGGALDVTMSVGGDGKATDVKVRGTSIDDDALDRCVQVVVEGLDFPASDLKVTVKIQRLLQLPPMRATLRGRKCSATSTLPTALRRGPWNERLARQPAWTVYLDAKQACELPTWTDRRTLLELVLLTNSDGLWRVDVARNLEGAGEVDAAALLRREAVRRARTPAELKAIQLALLGDERYPVGTFRKQYKAADDDKARLAVVRRFLGLAPHDPRLRRRVLALLEALGQKQELGEEVRRIRLDPFADAGLLADGASALRRIGDEAEARRTFGELAERAPADPWARAYLGDRLRGEGWFDDATLAYTVLEDLAPDEPPAIIRLALAHAGGGRLDIAERMLARVAQTGGRSGDAKMGELAERVAEVLLAEARGKQGVTPDDADRLVRASLELPHPGAATTVLLRAPGGALPIDAKLLRGPKDAREERAPDIASPGIGVYALRLDPGDKSEVVLSLRRGEQLGPARATHVRVDAIVPEGAGKPPRMVPIEVDLPIDGKPVELKWTGEAWAR